MKRRIAGALMMLAVAMPCGCRMPSETAETTEASDPPAHADSSRPGTLPVEPFSFGRPDAVVMVTGGTNGMLEVCNCAGAMPGGLSRRSGMVASYRKAFGNVALIDAGDVFWIDPNDLRSEFVLRGYAKIGYDAVVLADQEWAAGPVRLRNLLAEAGTPAVTGNVVGPVVDAVPARTVRAGGVKLAVVAWVGEDAFRFIGDRITRRLRFRPLEDVARRVAALKRDGHVVVLVAHTGAANVDRAAAETNADLVVRGHTTKARETLRRVEGTAVMKIGGHETVGVVGMKVRGGRVTELEYRAEIVHARWPQDKRLVQIYQAYAHAAMRKALDGERTEGLRYLSSASCGHCHKPQHESWKTSPHAHAYATLVKAGREGDPDCLMCHTSGFKTKQGFYTVEKTPHLANVNCQDCHRFNDLEHRQKGYLFQPVGREVCTPCHTPVTDPTFNFEKRVAKIRCPHTPYRGPTGTFHADGK